MQNTQRKMYKLLKNTIKKDGVVHSIGIRCAVSKNLVLKIQGTKEIV